MMFKTTVNKLLCMGLVLAINPMLSFAQSKPDFQLKGQLSDSALDGNYIFLRYANHEGKFILDSTLIKGNQFSFEGKTQSGAQAFLMREKTNLLYEDLPSIMQMNLDAGKLHLKVPSQDFRLSILTGSKPHADFIAWKKLEEPLLEPLKPINELYNQKNNEYIEVLREIKTLEKRAAEQLDELTSIRDEMGPHQQKVSKLALKYIKENPDSYMSPRLLRGQLSSLPLSESKALFNALDPKIKASNLGIEIKKELDRISSGSTGSQAFEFSAMDIDGNELSLKEFRGQYVLLDFWASWCVPCRKGNPHLLELYSKYKSKGFEIIGISDDDSNVAAWKKAVEQDQIGVWRHVLRGLKKLENGQYSRADDISDQFGISTLPTKILVGPDGVIIGRFGSNGESDEQMDQKLKTIFGF